MKNFIALIIDSDLGARSRLKQAAVANHVFKEVLFAQDPKEGIAKIITLDAIDVVFVANRFGTESVHELARFGKNSSQGQDSAYILVLPQSEDMQQAVAGAVVEGMDGFLVEPFSADGVMETTRIAQRIKQENMEKRAKAAAALYVKEARSLFGRYRYFRKIGRSTASVIKEFQSIAKSISGMSHANKQYYIGTLIEEFVSAMPPQREYTGVSKRIKDRQDKKKDDDLKKAYE